MEDEDRQDLIIQSKDYLQLILSISDGPYLFYILYPDTEPLRPLKLMDLSPSYGGNTSIVFRLFGLGDPQITKQRLRERRCEFMKYEWKRKWIIPVALSFLLFFFTGPIIAEDKVVSGKSDDKSEVTESVQSQVNENTDKKVSKQRKKILSEAAAADDA